MKFKLIIVSYISVLITLSLITQSCRKEKIEKLSGIVQKGPFINGTVITLTELDNNFKATGKKFTTEIVDDKGSFSFPDVSLESSYAILSADGYYYDEVKGELSVGRVTLNAIVDATKTSTVNINILSHLEKSRVEYLIEKGSEFLQAKQQAQQEILKIFNFNATISNNSENLDISQTGEDNAKLLAISAILQGTHTSAQLSELLSNISTDIREDGILNSTVSQSALINEANYLNFSRIRQNLESRYNSLGINSSIGNFEKYIEDFISTTDYTITKKLSFPVTGKYGSNILDTTNSHFNSGSGYRYSLTTELPQGINIKILFKNKSSSYSSNLWCLSESHNLNITIYNAMKGTQEFTSIEPGKPIDCCFCFMGNGSAIIEIYENGKTTPSRVKNITWD